MMKCNPVVIDGNIFLMAHSSAILGNMKAKDIIHNSTHENIMYRGRGILIKSMIAMILSNVSDMFKQGLKPTSVGMVWDQRKDGNYHKSTIINTLDSNEGYKGDRGYLTANDIKALEDKVETATNAEEEEQFEEELLSAKKSVIINSERYHAREFLREHLPKFGIPSFSKSGWEADDLDYVFGKETAKNGGYQIHYSGDSDWGFSLEENDIFWQVNRGKLYKKTYADIRKKYGIREDLSLQQFAELNFSTRGSHNFLRSTLDPSIKRVTKPIMNEIFDGDYKNIVDMKRFEAQRKCFQIEEFPGIEEVRELYKEVTDFKVTGTVDEFKAMLTTISMGDDQKFFMTRNYNDFLAKMRSSILSQII